MIAINHRVLCAASLESRFGFDDGGILGERITGYASSLPALDTRGLDTHDVLAWLVRKHLLPLLPGVEVYEIGTSHNPIRTDQKLTETQKSVCAVIGQAEVDEAVAAIQAQRVIFENE